MQVVRHILELREQVAAARADNLTIGFVPTMGALHAGHARLIETARAKTGFVVVSIFVNPTQFGPNEDFDRYPRTPDGDFEICRGAGADLVFMPETTEVYPAGFQGTTVEVPNLGSRLCGAFRPGHFKGVASIVLKLLNMANPDLAFFGEKDYQQLVLIRRMVDDLNLPVGIEGVPTVREADGLALSSRNRYLGKSDRKKAVALWLALQAACDAVRQGEHDANVIRQILRSSIESQSRFQLQYADVVHGETLAPLNRLAEPIPARALVAAYLGTTRLIDNVALPAVSTS